ncbi:MAG: hypothetical protein ABW000_24615 [Actinoplanes sp.]
MNDIQRVRRSHAMPWLITAVVAVVAVVAVYLIATRSRTHSISFEVDSSGEKVSSVTYGVGDKQLGKDVGEAAAAPWSKTYDTSDTDGKIWLHVLAPAGGAITCTIRVDGELAVEATTPLGAVCEIPFDDAF